MATTVLDDRTCAAAHRDRGLDALLPHLRRHGQNIDTTTPGGKLIFHIFGALAEFERDIATRSSTNRTATGQKP